MGIDRRKGAQPSDQGQRLVGSAKNTRMKHRFSDRDSGLESSSLSGRESHGRGSADSVVFFLEPRHKSNKSSKIEWIRTNDAPPPG